MNLLHRRSSSLAAALVVLLLSAGATAGEPIIHIVEAGDSLSELAQQYEVTVEDLRRWNHLNGDVIRLGFPLVVGERETRNDAEEPAEESPSTNRTYVVAESDTAGCIAQRFGVTVDQLQRWNRGMDPDHIEVGQRLRIAVDSPDELDEAERRRTSRQPTTYRIRSGDTICAIAARHRMTFDQIRELNPGLELDHINVDQEIRVLTLGPPSESIGSAACGRLVNGHQLPPHAGYVLRNPERSWATDETIAWIHDGFDAVLRQYPSATKVRVHDLSLRDGGPIDDHRSHQSGRDVDITYYQRRCPGDGCPLEAVRPRNMHLGPQWTLLEHWLRRGVAQVIFLDYGLQEVLYNYARRHGATRAELSTWFQYPRGRNASVGVIRHFPNHFDHVHVRFMCPEGDELCR